MAIALHITVALIAAIACYYRTKAQDYAVARLITPLIQLVAPIAAPSAAGC